MEITIDLTEKELKNLEISIKDTLEAWGIEDPEKGKD